MCLTLMRKNLSRTSLPGALLPLDESCPWESPPEGVLERAEGRGDTGRKLSSSSAKKKKTELNYSSLNQFIKQANQLMHTQPCLFIIYTHTCAGARTESPGFQRRQVRRRAELQRPVGRLRSPSLERNHIKEEQKLCTSGVPAANEKKFITCTLRGINMRGGVINCIHTWYIKGSAV